MPGRACAGQRWVGACICGEWIGFLEVIGSCMSCSSFVSSPVVVMAVWTGGVRGGRRSQQSPSSSCCCMALACEWLGICVMRW
jgi:hypothetical protein